MITTVLLLMSLTRAVRVGDEKFELESAGHFYVFANKAIHVINPLSRSIVKNISREDLPTTWGDVVYAEDSNKKEFYIFAADRSNNRLIVIDTLKKDIVASVQIGQRPVHMYAISSRQEIWTHSDVEGHFDVVHLNSPSALKAKVRTHTLVPSHGKLLFDDELGSTAFSTNTLEPGIHQLDLSQTTSNSAPAFFNFSKMSLQKGWNFTCSGTHGIAYSRINRHLYVECSGRGLWEFSTETKELIHVFPEVKGQVYTPPSNDWVVAVNSGASKVHILLPRASNSASSLSFEVSVPGSPSKPAFFRVPGRFIPVVGDQQELSDYLGFFALTTPNSSLAGVAVIDFESVIRGTLSRASTILAGSVTQGTFFTHRSLKLGGQFVVTETHNPQGVYLIETLNHDAAYLIRGPENAQRIAWAPERNDASTSNTMHILLILLVSLILCILN